MVTNQDQKSQDANKLRALEALKERVFQKEFERHMEELSSRRKLVTSSNDRSDKIRTYNFPQDRITDHRLNMTVYGISQFFGGEFIEEFIDEYQKRVLRERIDEMMRKELEMEQAEDQKEEEDG